MNKPAAVVAVAVVAVAVAVAAVVVVVVVVDGTPIHSLQYHNINNLVRCSQAPNSQPPFLLAFR